MLLFCNYDSLQRTSSVKTSHGVATLVMLILRTEVSSSRETSVPHRAEKWGLLHSLLALILVNRAPICLRFAHGGRGSSSRPLGSAQTTLCVPLQNCPPVPTRPLSS